MQLEVAGGFKKWQVNFVAKILLNANHQVHRFSEGFGIEGVGTEDVGGHGFVTNTTASNPYPLLSGGIW